MKPYNKFVNHKNHTGLPKKEEAPKPSKDTMQQKVAALFQNLVQGKTTADAMPEEVKTVEPEAQPIAATVNGIAQRLLEQVDKDAEEADAALESKPSCLDDLFWDMKIESNSCCLHKW